jgi:hypothetical protein
MVLLLSNTGDGHEPGCLEPSKLPLHGAGTGARQGDDLVGVEAPPGIAEDHHKDALPYLGEQRIGQPERRCGAEMDLPCS